MTVATLHCSTTPADLYDAALAELNIQLSHRHTCPWHSNQPGNVEKIAEPAEDGMGVQPCLMLIFSCQILQHHSHTCRCPIPNTHILLQLSCSGRHQNSFVPPKSLHSAIAQCGLWDAAMASVLGGAKLGCYAARTCQHVGHGDKNWSKTCLQWLMHGFMR